MVELKRERRTEKVHAAVEPSLKKKITAYKKKKGVTESAAINYILALFFETGFEKKEVYNRIEEERSEIQAIEDHEGA